MKKNIRHLGNAIVKAKEKLENIAKKKGISENFGQKEVEKLRDTYIDSTDYSSEMSHAEAQIDSFESWCANYSL